MRYCEVKNGVVTKVYTRKWRDDLTAVPDNVGVGWRDIGGSFTPPTTPGDPLDNVNKDAEAATRHPLVAPMLSLMAKLAAGNMANANEEQLLLAFKTEAFKALRKQRGL